MLIKRSKHNYFVLGYLEFANGNTGKWIIEAYVNKQSRVTCSFMNFIDICVYYIDCQQDEVNGMVIIVYFEKAVRYSCTFVDNPRFCSFPIGYRDLNHFK